MSILPDNGLGTSLGAAMMWTVLSTFAVVVGGYGWGYGTSNATAAKRKDRPGEMGLPWFRHIYGFIQASTLFVCVGVWGTETPWLLVIGRPEWVVFAGCAVAVAGVVLFLWSLSTLADNYSPCYEVAVPATVVDRATRPIPIFILQDVSSAALASGLGATIQKIVERVLENLSRAAVTRGEPWV